MLYQKSLIAQTFTAVVIIAFFFSSCGSNNSTSNSTKDSTNASSVSTDTLKAQKPESLQPAGEKPAWGKSLTDPMAVVIEKLKSFNAPPIVSLSAPDARKQPSPADAVKAVMQQHSIAMPPNNTDTIGKDIMVPGGKIHLRIYTPKTGKDVYPVIVYYHGGGWVIADLNTYDASAAGLANMVEAVVVSVAYRQAPENKFPIAHNDSYAAYEWVVKNAATIKGEAKEVAVVGESAGGNLAAAVSMMARDKNFQLPICQVLVYPIAGYDFTTASYKESDSTMPLNSGMMKWFFDKYLSNPSQAKDPKISLVTANLKGLPTTTIIAAQYDPLRSEGELLSDNFKKAGVSTDYKLYKGTTHEFFGMGAVVPDAKNAEDYAASQLKKAFKK